MRKYTHVKCLNTIKEDDIIVFKKGEIYKIMGFDYNSLVYYIEPEYYENVDLPDEYVIQALSRDFEFMIIEK